MTDEVLLNICQVYNDAKEMLAYDDWTIPAATLGVIDHVCTDHTSPPVELSPKERDLIRLAAGVTIAVEDHMEAAAIQRRVANGEQVQYVFDANLVGNAYVIDGGEGLFCPDHGEFFTRRESDSPTSFGMLLEAMKIHHEEKH